MKKYLNKGLIYQWFNSAKAVILLGLIVWGYMSYMIFGNEISDMRWRISDSFCNYFMTFDLCKYVDLGIIFVIIFFAAQGISKRNNLMFLNSSPYTKKQIKYNEIICLGITEGLFIATFLYMAVIRYFNYRNLLSIVDGYFQVVGIEVIKMILFGIIGILFVMIIDSMFSNSIVGVIAMISAIPLSIFVIFAKSLSIVRYIAVKDGKNIFYLLDKPLEKNESIICKNPLFRIVSMDNIHLSNIFYNVAILLIVIAIIFLIYNKMQKLNSLEYSTKIFSSKTNEKIIRILCSVGAGCFASLFFTEHYIDKLKIVNYRIPYSALSGMNLVKVLSVDILCVMIVAFICNIILKKILKIIE